MKIIFCLIAAVLSQDVSKTTSIGRSNEGRPLELIVLADPIETADEQPALLIVAGLDGRHEMGPLLADQIMAQILENHRALLSEYTIYLLPRMNPDAAASNAQGAPLIQRGTSGNIDDDRDGMINEDAPRDLNGDGMITMMRWRDATLETPATHLKDPADDRLMKTPDRTKGERAVYSLAIEGIDADGDGRIGEDGPGGVVLDHNFMHLWPEHQPNAGPYQLSESESRALAEFVIAHPNIGAAIVYGPHDNLVHEPNTKDKDITGRIPKQLSNDDKDTHRLVADAYKDIVAQEHATRISNEGSLHGWLYAHRGIPTYASTGWGRPKPSELPAADTPEDEEAETDDEDALEPADPEEGQWLIYSDRDRNGSGFVAWEQFDHPSLGTVEIGGWTPGFKMNAPTEELPALAARHAEWIAHLTSMQPQLELIGPTVQAISNQVAQIRISIVNTGSLPTRSAHATRTRATTPTLVKLNGIPLDHILQGQQTVQIDRLKPGEEETITWTLRLTPDAQPTITVEDSVLNVTMERIVENNAQ